MEKETQPQEIPSYIKENAGNGNVIFIEDEEHQQGKFTIVGGGDPNLSPDAGKPMI
ncbi:hypothetical protein [Bacillus sp. JJ1764]|uniref:hypothetical protein n=1 Tax=Bacillus sp. JJ1764 TaxID=3122964 RepID=UPI003000B62A